MGGGEHWGVGSIGGWGAWGVGSVGGGEHGGVGSIGGGGIGVGAWGWVVGCMRGVCMGMGGGVHGDGA